MAKNSIRVTAKVVAKPNSLDQVRAILSDLVEPTRKEAGCLSYELLQNRTDQTDFTFMEEWASDAAIEGHLKTKHISDALTNLAGLIETAPDIQRYTVLKKDS